jgi:uncharacterized protein
MWDQLSGVLELLVVQATPFCNLDCDYCYLPDRGNRHRMSERTLQALFRRVFESPFLGSRLTVVWHSGEPLILPVEYYRKAFAIAEEFKPKHVDLSHSIQTNGTLISEEWAAFILDTRTRIGVSIDGPCELHDRHRRTRTGFGTYDRVISGVRSLKRSDVPFHVITVLTRDSLSKPDLLYGFYQDEGIRRICFNVEEIEGEHRQSGLEAHDAEPAFRRFMERFLELTIRDGKGGPWVREFAAASASIIGGLPDIPNPQATPFAIVSVDVEGQVSTFSPELLGVKSADFSDFTIGNVHSRSLLEMARSLPLHRMAREIKAGVERCRHECDYFGVCGGGAPANKIFENGSFNTTETMFCRFGKKAIIDVVLANMEASMADESHSQSQLRSAGS